MPLARLADKENSSWQTLIDDTLKIAHGGGHCILKWLRGSHIGFPSMLTIGLLTFWINYIDTYEFIMKLHLVYSIFKKNTSPSK